MGSMTTASSSALSWVDVAKPPFTTTGWDPVMALAQNHIHFLNVPGVPAGSADIFVIHCLSILLFLVSVQVNVFSLSVSFFQPTPQAFPLPGGGAFPATHGQTASFFQPSLVCSI